MYIYDPSSEMHFLPHDFSSWGYETHLCLFLWVFINGCRRYHHTFLQFFCYHGVFLLIKICCPSQPFFYWFPQSMTMNLIWWRLPSSVCTATFIVLVLFYAYTDALLRKISLWFPWWLMYIGSLGVICTPYGIKNSIMSGLELNKKIAVISNRNTTSCGSAYIL